MQVPHAPTGTDFATRPRSTRSTLWWPSGVFWPSQSAFASPFVASASRLRNPEALERRAIEFDPKPRFGG
jgi:hypothetical protein